MEEVKLLSRAGVASAADVQEDTIVFWIRQGLLESQETGERKHKRFTKREVRMAVLLRELRSYGMNAAAMAEIVGELRASLAKYDALPSHRYLGEAALHASAASGPLPDDPDDIKREWVWDYAGDEVEAGRLTVVEAEEVRTLAAALPHRYDDGLWLAWDFESCEGAVSIWRDESGGFVLRGGELGNNLPAASVLMFDLRRLFEGLCQ